MEVQVDVAQRLVARQDYPGRVGSSGGRRKRCWDPSTMASSDDNTPRFPFGQNLCIAADKAPLIGDTSKYEGSPPPDSRLPPRSVNGQRPEFVHGEQQRVFVTVTRAASATRDRASGAISRGRRPTSGERTGGRSEQDGGPPRCHPGLLGSTSPPRSGRSPDRRAAMMALALEATSNFL